MIPPPSESSKIHFSCPQTPPPGQAAPELRQLVPLPELPWEHTLSAHPPNSKPELNRGSAYMGLAAPKHNSNTVVLNNFLNIKSFNYDVNSQAMDTE